MEKYNPNFKPEEYKHFTVDLSGCKQFMEMHYCFRDSCDFPDFYGCNWDAFWDCLTGFIEVPAFIHVVGLSKACKDVQDSVPMMKEILQQAKEKYHEIDYTIEW